MTTKAGKLRHRIEIQSRQKTQDENTGAEVVTWVTKAYAWAGYTAVSAKQFIAAQENKSEVTGTFLIRYQDGITPADRILWRNKYYDIQGVLEDPNSALEYLTLPVLEGVSNG